MRSAILHIIPLRWRLLFSILLLLFCTTVQAQEGSPKYTVKNGRMYIELLKNANLEQLDSFITQFELDELKLKDFIVLNFFDSLKKHGWTVEKAPVNKWILSKVMEGFEKIADPGEKIFMSDDKMKQTGEFTSVSSNIKFGINKFKGSPPEVIRDSVVRFYLPKHSQADQVILSGAFSDWSETALPMTKTDSGWIYDVPLTAGKHWYKFIVDGEWILDPNNQIRETDTEGNVNNIYFQPNHKFVLKNFQNARQVSVAGSFNNWHAGVLKLFKTAEGWELPVYLADGTHTYRFIVDGKWMADPDNKEKLPNEFNDFNSVIRLGKAYIFSLDGYTDAKKVAIAGSFNGWRKDEYFLEKTDKGWVLPMHIAAGNYEYQIWVDGRQLKSNRRNGNMSFVVGANYEFRLKAFPNAKEVYLSGDFNDWSPSGLQMEKVNDEWVIQVHLSPGKHLYKFVVDGQWIIDPANKWWEQNEHGTGNSVMWFPR